MDLFLNGFSVHFLTLGLFFAKGKRKAPHVTSKENEITDLQLIRNCPGKIAIAYISSLSCPNQSQAV